MDQIKKHLIIIGFMGTGKTSVGARLAEKTSLDWIDTDKFLEKKFGCSIAQYFSKYGEALFRSKEMELLEELLLGPPRLITTGGGSVLAYQNRKLMLQHGFVVTLTADPYKIAERLSGCTDRPLLVDGNLFKLWHQRLGKYDFAHVNIDTTRLSVSEVADLLMHIIDTLR